MWHVHAFRNAEERCKYAIQDAQRMTLHRLRRYVCRSHDVQQLRQQEGGALRKVQGLQ
jgi:hypothetical protein